MTHQIHRRKEIIIQIKLVNIASNCVVTSYTKCSRNIRILFFGPLLATNNVTTALQNSECAFCPVSNIQFKRATVPLSEMSGMTGRITSTTKI
jgi:hypothetical protein